MNSGIARRDTDDTESGEQELGESSGMREGHVDKKGAVDCYQDAEGDPSGEIPHANRIVEVSPRLNVIG